MWIDTTIQRPWSSFQEYKDKGLVIVGFPANTLLHKSQEQKKCYFLSNELRSNFPNDGQNFCKRRWYGGYLSVLTQNLKMDYKIESRMEFFKNTQLMKTEEIRKSISPQTFSEAAHENAQKTTTFLSRYMSIC
jgi:uncharacterized NAD(P)/FAD-binding protein YdhS